ncbi:cytochrome P450 [Streptomyces sp. NPDC002643]
MGHTHIIDPGEYGPGFTENPHPVYAELRALGPVHRVRLPAPDARHEVWLVVGYEEARAALADPRLAKDGSKIGVTFLDEELIRTTDEDGDRLSPDELRGMAFVLLIAGHETTVNLITGAVHALLTHPGQLAEPRADMSLVDAVVEETPRHDGPVETAAFRYAAELLDIAGTAVAPGETVMIGLSAADRDDTRYPTLDRFDLHRDTRGHLAFGHGIHHCLGAPLARLEAHTALTALLTCCPDLALVGPPGPWLPGMLMRGVRTLPLRW